MRGVIAVDKRPKLALCAGGQKMVVNARANRGSAHARAKRPVRTKASPKLSANPATAYTIRDVTFIVVLLVGFLLALNRQTILPDRFLRDAETIRQLASQDWSAPLDPSYNSVAAVYRILGLDQSPTAAAIIGLAAGSLPYLVTMVRARTNPPDAIYIAVLALGIVLTAIYMGTYSKEVFTVPIVIALILMRTGKLRNLLIVSSMLLYAANFRTYWYLTVAELILLMAVWKFRARPRVIYLLAALGVLTMSLAVFYVLGLQPDYFRDVVNVYREVGDDVGTLISAYVNWPEPLGGTVNNLLNYVFLQFPVPLILKFSPYYLFIALVIGGIWAVFYRAMMALNARGEGGRRSSDAQIALFVLAFASTQALFEPDYGSALKHLTPFIPLILWLHASAKANPGTRLPSC